ncbi:DNA repair and recombination protein RAD54 isoform X2 [Ananas comosus]|uniref:DNA repair and recombination protein RAD54 isoform X2 n=1 Tax=Ananas comosus TaxID=4615 RepID=A0A6P5F8X9_ANACO|nr:DNA repair and recombination protein RAD54 isoform X2 [Ananas comosus]
MAPRRRRGRDEGEDEGESEEELEIASSSDDDDYSAEADEGDDDEDEGEEEEGGDREEDVSEEGERGGEGCSLCPPSSDRERKSQNVADLVRGNLLVRRQPLIPRILSVSDGVAMVRKPFKPPFKNEYSNFNEELARRLLARKSEGSSKDQALPPGVEPLVLWQHEGHDEENGQCTPIEVDPSLVRYLRPHQREGVQFMFDCVSGLSSAEGISGCILADDMGLGKTLQSITLLYTLLRQGFDGKPIVKRALIVTPTSLVSNWESEINKWLGGKVQLLSLCESTRADVLSGIESFLKPRSPFQVLIISYETFRMHSSKFERTGSCDLLICDEAHRLKNDQTLTNRALAALPCNRRILLSGTPMQNDLEEFFSMVNFTNPGVLGDVAYFRRYYETPIICGREPMASEDERKLGAERSVELSAKVNQFILRRTNALLSNHLPPKIVEVVCCKLTPLQLELYNHLIHSKNVKRLISEETKQAKILAYITALKKLCNHPKLIYDSIKSSSSGTTGFEDCMRFFPPELFSGRSGSWTGGGGMWVELSGKMHVLARLLGHLRQRTNDRIVLVSNYTQTLDLFAQLCRERRYPYVRLDGTTSISKRQKLVNQFNDQSKDEFAFLLSSKAGGCGLNLIGGNRLVLFDPDWNPANDKQAAARVWRDGQKKRVYIYRFLSTGTIEEKVYKRQMSKEGLQKIIQQEHVDNQKQVSFFSMEDLRDLFTFHEHVRSEIHENMKCTRCERENLTVTDDMDDLSEIIGDKDSITGGHHNDVGGFAEITGCLHKLKNSEKQVGTPSEEDLVSWGHHFDPSSVPDAILQSSAGDEVTFVFTNQVDGKLVPVESGRGLTGQQSNHQEDCMQKDETAIIVPQQSRLLPSSPSKFSNSTNPQLQSSTLNEPTASIRTSLNSVRSLRRPNAAWGDQFSLKRIHVATDISDDDFL